MLEIKNLSKKYGSQEALKNVNLAIPQGEIIGLFALELQVLWVSADDGSRIDMAVLADAYTAVDGHIVVNDSAFAYLHIIIDAGERANCYRWMKLSFWMDKIHSLYYNYEFNVKFLFSLYCASVDSIAY